MEPSPSADPTFIVQKQTRVVKTHTLTEEEIASIGLMNNTGSVALAVLTSVLGTALGFFLDRFSPDISILAILTLVAVGAACVLYFTTSGVKRWSSGATNRSK